MPLEAENIMDQAAIQIFFFFKSTFNLVNYDYF